MAKEFDTAQGLVARWHNDGIRIHKFGYKLSKNKSHGLLNKHQPKLCRRIGGERESFFPAQERELNDLFAKRRLKTRVVGELWLKLKFKKLSERDKPARWESFKHSSGWSANFKHKYNVALRKRTNKNHRTLRKREDLLQEFRQYMHNVGNSNMLEHQTIEYGRFAPENTDACDEIPMPFVFGQESTLEYKRAATVPMKNRGKGLNKRQYTVGLTLRGNGKQHIKPTIMFRGRGLRILKKEKNQHAAGVCHWFQASAWMDGICMMNQLHNFDDCRAEDDCNHLKASVVLDNDGSHQDDVTKECAWEGCNALLTYTLPNCADAVGVVDRVAHIFKYDVRKEYENWVEENFEEWEQNGTTAME